MNNMKLHTVRTIQGYICTVQHEATYVEHETTYVEHEATYIQRESRYVQHGISSTPLCMHMDANQIYPINEHYEKKQFFSWSQVIVLVKYEQSESSENFMLK